MAIQYSTDFLDIQKMVYGYPKIGMYFRICIIHFWISKNQLWISNIQLIFGYPKMYFRISITRFLDIQK